MCWSARRTGNGLSTCASTYGVDGTEVLIDAMPEPPCDPTLGFYRARLKPGIIDNTLETLALGDYNSSGSLHTTDAGRRCSQGGWRTRLRNGWRNMRHRQKLL